VQTPQSRIVDTDSAEGRAITDMVTSKLETLSEHRQETFAAQMAACPYIQVMPRLEGKAMTKLDQNGVQAVLQSTEVIAKLGRVSIADIFLNNWDRVTRTQCNLGNFMVSEEVEGPTLVAIDSDAKMNPASRLQRVDITFALSPRGSQTIAGAFISNITKNGTRYQPREDEIHGVERAFRIGILEGAKTIIDVLTTERTRCCRTKRVPDDTRLDAMTRIEQEQPGPEEDDRRLVRKSTRERLQVLLNAYVAQIDGEGDLDLEL
jgi:hypothetical protein